MTNLPNKVRVLDIRELSYIVGLMSPSMAQSLRTLSGIITKPVINLPKKL